MYKITKREAIYVVTENTNDSGFFSRNVASFLAKEPAEYYSAKLNEKNENPDKWYEVEKIDLLEVKEELA